MFYGRELKFSSWFDTLNAQNVLSLGLHQYTILTTPVHTSIHTNYLACEWWFVRAHQYQSAVATHVYRSLAAGMTTVIFLDLNINFHTDKKPLSMTFSHIFVYQKMYDTLFSSIHYSVLALFSFLFYFLKLCYPCFQVCFIQSFAAVCFLC